MHRATLLRRARTTWRAVTLTLVVAVLLLPIALLAGFRVVDTPSVPTGLWLVHAGGVERGAYIMACLPSAIAAVGKRRGYLDDGICPERVAPVMKHVAAVPGDLVVVRADRIVVNGRVVAGSAALRTDAKHRAIPRTIAPGVYRVGAHQYWLMGDWYRSWDSRYFGAVPASSIVGIGIPLFVRPAVS